MPTITTSRKRIADENITATFSPDTKEWIVTNHVKQTEYSVMLTAHGYWHCSCPYMQKGAHNYSGVCKHITLVLDTISELQKNETSD